VFIHHVQTPFPKPLKSQHTIFEFSVKTNNGVQLQSQDWQDVRDQLVSPADYRFTQAIGSATQEKVSILMIEPDGSSTAIEFPVTHFLVSGRIPRPAS